MPQADMTSAEPVYARETVTREEFGWALKRLREAAGYKKQNIAADLIGVKPTQLSKWERGQRLPGIVRIVQIVEAWGKSLAELEAIHHERKGIEGPVRRLELKYDDLKSQMQTLTKEARQERLARERAALRQPLPKASPRGRVP